MGQKSRKRHPEGNQQGTLYCVATPIGEVSDWSPRAESVLTKVDLILSEDTRVFKKLCFDAKVVFKASLVSFDSFRESSKTDHIIQELLSGSQVALVSDAGTPNVSDPGHFLLQRAFEEGISVSPVPGPCSVIAALSVCPFAKKAFCFLGFAPRKSSDRKKFFSDFRFDGPIVVFESPHRLSVHIDDAIEVLGSGHTLFIARELTKKYEQTKILTLGQWKIFFEKTQPLGEFVLIYAPRETKEITTEELDSWLTSQIEKDTDIKVILFEAKKRFKINRKELYSKIILLKNKP